MSRFVVKKRLELEQLQSRVDACPAGVCEARVFPSADQIWSMKHALCLEINSHDLQMLVEEANEAAEIRTH